MGPASPPRPMARTEAASAMMDGSRGAPRSWSAVPISVMSQGRAQLRVGNRASKEAQRRPRTWAGIGRIEAG